MPNRNHKKPLRKKPPARRLIYNLMDATPKSSVPKWAASLAERFSSNLTPDVTALLRAQAMLLSQPSDAAGNSEQPGNTNQHTVTIIRTQKALRELYLHFQSATLVAIDLETHGLNPRRGEIVGIGIAVANDAFYIPTAHKFEESGQLLPDQLTATQVARALKLQALPLVAHNSKFELSWLRQHTGVTPNIVWDTMLAARLQRSDLSADLEKLAVRMLDVPGWSLPQDQIKQIQTLPIDQVARYCAKDCIYTLRITEKQKPCLK